MSSQSKSAVLDFLSSDSETAFHALRFEYAENVNLGEGFMSSDEGVDLITEASKDENSVEWKIYDYDPSLKDMIKGKIRVDDKEPYILQISDNWEFSEFIGGGSERIAHVGLIDTQTYDKLLEELSDNGYEIENYIGNNITLIDEN